MVKNPSVNAGDIRDVGLSSGRWQPTPVFLSGESHGQSSLAGYSPWDHKESDTTERLNINSKVISNLKIIKVPCYEG